MKLEGIWKVEMLGPYGWESMATAFIENGIYRSASKHHYTTGTYTHDNGTVEIKAVNCTFGEARTMFGDNSNAIPLHFEGKVTGDDQIIGTAEGEAPGYNVAFRATRLADLD